MTTFTIQLPEASYHRLEKAAEQSGKSVPVLIEEWIARLPEDEASFDLTQDPVFQMEGYESDVPADLSVHIDQYLYGERQPQ